MLCWAISLFCFEQVKLSWWVEGLYYFQTHYDLIKKTMDVLQHTRLIVGDMECGNCADGQ
jgi:hypothetical protein